mgnify:CR=1 FL=1
MAKSKHTLDGYGDIEVDEKTKRQLEKTKNEKSSVKFDPASAKVRISIIMEGDLLGELRQLRHGAGGLRLDGALNAALNLLAQILDLLLGKVHGW